MKLTVRTFGVVHDILGGRVVEIELDNNRVADLRAALHASYPALRDIRSLLIAVNQNYADDNVLLKPDDEIALIPPVSGG